jgi:malonate transporter and related proteins
MDALINVVLPVFGIILTGYLAGRFEALGPESAAALNRFVYLFALPPALFLFTARAPIEKVFNWPFIGAFVGGSIATLLISLLVGRIWFRHNPATLTVQGLTAIFANVVYMGLPLLMTAYGPDGALPAIVAALIINVMFIGGAITVMDATRATGSSPLQAIGSFAKTLVRNPLISAPLLGILFSTLTLSLPKAASNFLELMAAATGPGALFALGLSLVGRKLTGNVVEIAWIIVLKLLVQPIITFVLVAYAFGMDPLWTRAAVLLAAMPVGAGAFVIAQQYNVQVQRVSAAIVISTALSLATIFVLLIWFGAN